MFNNCNLGWGFKIIHTVCSRPKIYKNESKIAFKKVWINPEFAHKLTLNIKKKRESLQLNVFHR